MKEFMTLSSEDVQRRMIKVESKDTYTDFVANDLSEHCIGQAEAAYTVARRMVLAESGMNDIRRPLGVMAFLGETGVGKTEMAHAAAKHWFGNEESEQLKILDCSEYEQNHQTLRLTGAPPSYVGYSDRLVIEPAFLANRNILVLDEWEKAGPSFHKLFLGVFEDARLSVHNGEQLNFNNSLIILTSNVGAEELQKAKNGSSQIGFQSGSKEQVDPKIAVRAFQKRFSHTPELLGRIDDVVTFNSLQDEHYAKIFDKFVSQKNNSMKDRLALAAPFLAVTEEFKNHVLEGLDKTYGARDMRKALDRELFHKMADLFMNQDMTGRPIVASFEDGETVFYTDEVEEWCDDGEEALKALPEFIDPPFPDEGNIVEFKRPKRRKPRR